MPLPAFPVHPHPRLPGGIPSEIKSSPTVPASPQLCGLIGRDCRVLCCVPQRSPGVGKRQGRSPRPQPAAWRWDKWDRNTAKARGKSSHLPQSLVWAAAARLFPALRRAPQRHQQIVETRASLKPTFAFSLHLLHPFLGTHAPIPLQRRKQTHFIMESVGAWRSPSHRNTPLLDPAPAACPLWMPKAEQWGGRPPGDAVTLENQTARFS